MRSTPPIFPSRGTQPDADGYPHYRALAALDAAERDALARTQRRRRAERASALAAGGAQWRRRVVAARSGLAECLSLEFTPRRAAAAAPVVEHAVDLTPSSIHTVLPSPLPWTAVTYRLSQHGPEGAPIALMAAGPAYSAALPAVLVLPDAGFGLVGAQSPESVLRDWLPAFVGKAALVAAPRLPAAEAFCTPTAKQRLIEGSSALGRLVGEAALALDGLLSLPGAAAGGALVAGRGLGGLVALILAALDARVRGVAAEDPLSIGGLDTPFALTVPQLWPTTDLEEIAALIAPRPLALVGDGPRGLLEAPRASTRALAAAAAPAYRRARSSLRRFAPAKRIQAVHWLLERPAAKIPLRSPELVIQPPSPQRVVAREIADLRTWRAAAPVLMRELRRVSELPARTRALGTRLMGRAVLEHYTRSEYHVRTYRGPGGDALANLVFLRPHSARGRTATVLHLPGSGSDVARVEREFAHELVAEGWNAAIIDARVALHPNHAGISEGRPALLRSLHDLLAAADVVFARHDVDRSRVATMGVSQGGTHAWMLAAADKRIAAAAPVCGLCTWRGLDKFRDERADNQKLRFFDSHSPYYFIPDILSVGDQQEFAALIAPRPLMVVGADHDNCFAIADTRACASDLAHIYALHGRAQAFRYHEFAGEHSMPLPQRQAVYRFFHEVFEARR